MEERVSPPPNATDDQPRPLPLPPSATFRSGTYVVQVPKDQIYRTPPPENALIAERYRIPSHQNNYCFSFLLKLFIIIFVIFLLLVISAAIFYITLKPKNPIFLIDHFVVKNQNSHHLHHYPHYYIALKTKNPNKGMGINYRKGGSVSLYFRDLQIAIDNYPPVAYQGYKESKVFHLDLVGSDVVLPREIQRSMKGLGSKGGISLSLSIKIPVKMKIGVIKTLSMDMVTACDLRVSTLAKGTHILSQKCQTKVKI